MPLKDLFDMDQLNRNLVDSIRPPVCATSRVKVVIHGEVAPARGGKMEIVGHIVSAEDTGIPIAQPVPQKEMVYMPLRIISPRCVPESMRRLQCETEYWKLYRVGSDNNSLISIHVEPQSSRSAFDQNLVFQCPSGELKMQHEHYILTCGVIAYRFSVKSCPEEKNNCIRVHYVTEDTTHLSVLRPYTQYYNIADEIRERLDELRSSITSKKESSPSESDMDDEYDDPCGDGDCDNETVKVDNSHPLDFNKCDIELTTAVVTGFTHGQKVIVSTANDAVSGTIVGDPFKVYLPQVDADNKVSVRYPVKIERRNLDGAVVAVDVIGAELKHLSKLR